MQSFFYTQQYYTMDNKPIKWKIAYYPLNGTYINSGKFDVFGEPIKKWEKFEEPRALIETPINNEFGKPIGIDFREVPLRYLEPIKP